MYRNPEIKKSPVRTLGHDKMFLYVGHEFISQKIRSRKFHLIEMKFIQKVVKKGDTVLDLGANIGYFTLILAKLVGKWGKVFAFEPDVDNYYLLRRNVENCKYKNVVCVNKAVSNSNYAVKLYKNDVNNSGSPSILFPTGDNKKHAYVDGVKLDDYLKGYDKNINFIKSDLQGAEYFALLGMKNLIKRNEDLKMLIEYWPGGLRKLGVNPKKLISFLEQNKFKIKMTRNLKNINSNKFNTDLYCYREE